MATTLTDSYSEFEAQRAEYLKLSDASDERRAQVYEETYARLRAEAKAEGRCTRSTIAERRWAARVASYDDADAQRLRDAALATPYGRSLKVSPHAAAHVAHELEPKPEPEPKHTKATNYMRGYANIASVHGKSHTVAYRRDRQVPSIPVSAACGQNLGRYAVPTDDPVNCAKCLAKLEGS